MTLLADNVRDRQRTRRVAVKQSLEAVKALYRDGVDPETLYHNAGVTECVKAIREILVRVP